jgi:hypothetical protein
MATVNLGSIKFKWKGTYAGGTAYTIDDVVSYNGSSYICILASTGNLPTDTTYFDQMSAKGTDGTNGTDGTDLTSTLTTQGDLIYRDGSGLQRLGAGTSGQVLQTGGTGANPVWADSSGAFLAVTTVYNSNTANYFSGQSGTQLQGSTYYPVGARIGGAFTKQSATSNLLISGHYSLFHSNTNLHGSCGWIVGYESSYVNVGEDARKYGWYHQPSAYGNLVHDYSFIITGIPAGSRTAYYAPAVNGTRTHTHELNPDPTSNNVANFGDTPSGNLRSYMIVSEFE